MTTLGFQDTGLLSKGYDIGRWLGKDTMSLPSRKTKVHSTCKHQKIKKEPFGIQCKHQNVENIKRVSGFNAKNKNINIWFKKWKRLCTLYINTKM